MKHKKWELSRSSIFQYVSWPTDIFARESAIFGLKNAK